ncbi:MAG: YaeQ family protein [Deltaproteobacteria bacterium]|nr:YaeQ family protein [Deltaproteobacteria bacterium]
MFRPERWEYRITLADVDRRINVDKTVVIGRHPSETTQHLVLRLLGYCFVYQETIELGAGVSLEGEPDLFAKDLTGQLSLWVGCGDVTPDLAKKVVQHNREAKAHAVFPSHAALDAFTERVRHWNKLPKNWGHLTAWVPPEAVVDHLEHLESLRQRWVVTLAGGHMYIEVDDVMLDGPVLHVVAPGG